jgi:hypothetical protein
MKVMSRSNKWRMRIDFLNLTKGKLSGVPLSVDAYVLF